MQSANMVGKTSFPLFLLSIQSAPIFDSVAMYAKTSMQKASKYPKMQTCYWFTGPFFLIPCGERHMNVPQHHKRNASYFHDLYFSILPSFQILCLVLDDSGSALGSDPSSLPLDVHVTFSTNSIEKLLESDRYE